jgi:hypothetical protein
LPRSTKPAPRVCTVSNDDTMLLAGTDDGAPSDDLVELIKSCR